ncbi:MAG: hypothetical protein AAF225_07765 [Pseudomonadota bacterium]
MSATDQIEGGELEARRARLLALKEQAAKIGQGAPAGASPAAAPPPPPSQASAAAAAPSDGGMGESYGGDRTKYFATFLLNSLRAKPEGEENPPMVPGTTFTEFGLGKVLDGLRERSDLIGAAGKNMTRRFHDFLTAPPAEGQQMASGVNLEHLERFVNFLQKMQQLGWEGVRKDMTSGEGQELLQAFSKPRIDKVEAEVTALRAEVTNLTKQIEELKAKLG